MRFSVMRRAAGVALALIWGGARLAQPLQAECPHHAAAALAQVASEHAAALTAEAGHDAHAAHAHHAPAATTAAPESPESPATPAHDGHQAPCECAAHCCAASVVAAPAPLPALAFTVIRPASRAAIAFESSAPRALVTYRQPPATAPPTARAV